MPGKRHQGGGIVRLARRTVDVNWAELRAEYVTEGASSLREFAEAHGVSYGALLRRASAEKWKRERRLFVLRARVARAEDELAFARRQAAAAARHVVRLAHDEAMPLDELWRKLHEADLATGQLAMAVSSLAWARRDLADAEAGKPTCYDPPFLQHDPTYGRIGSWPTYGDPDRQIGPRLVKLEH